MAKKTVNFSKLGIKKLPNDKPAVYKIQLRVVIITILVLQKKVECVKELMST